MEGRVAADFTNADGEVAMCYSALIRKDIHQLKKDFGDDAAERIQDLWKKVYVTERADPKKFKVVAESGRFFPHYLAPMLYARGGKLVGEMALYSAWPPPGIDPRKYSSFNARRDNLTSPFWNSAFGVNHGFVILAGFSEWVEVKDLLKAGVVTLDEVKAKFAAQAEERKARILAAGKAYAPTKTELTDPRFRKVIIDFVPKDEHPLLVPVIWNERDGVKGFAIVTDDPLPDIAEAGHDRSPIMLEPDAIKAWLHPQGKTAQELDAILSRKRKPHFQHGLAEAA